MFNDPPTQQANNTKLTRKEREMWNITTKALLHLGVILVVDVFFHYLYILTIPNDMKLVNKLSDWSLGEPSISSLTWLCALFPREGCFTSSFKLNIPADNDCA